MEFEIIETPETAKIKLNLMNKRMVFVFRYLSIVFIFFGAICTIVWSNSSYSNHSSLNGHHTYTTYHVGLGIGIGTLITAIYLELYVFKLKKTLNKFKLGIVKYTFSASGIKVDSPELEAKVNWKAIEEIKTRKGNILLATNNYSCPTMTFLKDQISEEQLTWIKSQIH